MTSRPRLSLLTLAIAALTLAGLGARAAEDKTPPVEQEFAVGVGAEYQAVGGNERHFDQYVTQPSGGYVSSVLWQRLDPAGGLSLDLGLRDLGEPGPSGDLWADWQGVRLDSQYRRSTYYFDFEPTSDRSRRRDYLVRLGPDASADRRYTWSLATRGVAVEGVPADGPLDWQNRNHTAALAVRAGSYWLGANYAREQFEVRAGDGPSGTMSSYGLTLSPVASQTTQIDASFVRHVTDVVGFSTPVRSWDATLNFSRPVSDDLMLLAELRRYRIDQTIILNAYGRQQTTARLEADYRLRPGTTLRGFYQNGVTDYVDGLQLNTVAVGSNAYGLSLYSRLSHALKFTGKFVRTDFNNRPLYYMVDTSFGDSLIYSTLKRLDLQMTYTPPKPWGLTAGWQRRSWDNDAQNISNSVNTTSVTGWWQSPGGKLSLNTSVMWQSFDLPLIDIVTLTGYTSKVMSTVVGASYLLNPRDTVYASFTEAVARGATADDCRRFTFGLNHQVGRTDRLTAEFNVGSFWDDNDPTLDYNTDLYRIAWQHQF
jgi:hypothetical protein